MTVSTLKQLFQGIAFKRLSAVEASPKRSRQHELNGSQSLRDLLGTGRLTSVPTQFVYVDGNGYTETSEGACSWYDARARKLHRAPEYRLYYPTTSVSELFREDDIVVVARKQDGTLLIVAGASNGSGETIVRSLFAIEGDVRRTFHGRDFENSDRLEVVHKLILEQLGFDTIEADVSYLDEMLSKFPTRLPSTKEFSAYARSKVSSALATEDPDAAILAWWEREEGLFKALERHFVGIELAKGFMKAGTPDVEHFISFSLSVQNARKSRAGHALENHVEALLGANKIRYARGMMTERKNKPDFIFPGAAEYRDPDFPLERLTMLAVKSSCKDRWRQILPEAMRVPSKHLLTLEAGISLQQTNEMHQEGVTLVLPRPLMSTFLKPQQQQASTVAEFLIRVRGLQAAPNDGPG